MLSSFRVVDLLLSGGVKNVMTCVLNISQGAKVSSLVSK